MRRAGLTILVCLNLVACASIGPGTIDRDRFDYGNAIANSWKEQTLLNILRLRYGEIPLFLEVTSVINQYSLEGEVRAGGTYFPNVAGDNVNAGATGRWSDRPTITYVPLTGEALTERLMKPLDPAAILFLAQGGWSMEFLFPLTVRAANGLQSVSGIEVFRGAGQESFFRLVEILSDLQRSGSVGLRIERRGKNESAVMFLRKQGEGKEEMAELRKLLGLNPDATEYQLTYGSLPMNDTEITLLTKSALEIMVELASWVDVPEEHVAEERTGRTRRPSVVGRYEQNAPIVIRSGTPPASMAFVSTEFRGTTFWIDDRDMGSKRTFAFLQFIFSLVETGRRQLAPVVTVGAGG